MPLAKAGKALLGVIPKPGNLPYATVLCFMSAWADALPPEQTHARFTGGEVMFIFFGSFMSSRCGGSSLSRFAGAVPFVLFAVALTCRTATAESLANLTVRIVDSLSMQPIPQRSVTLLPLQLHQLTDVNGIAQFQAVPPGYYLIRIPDQSDVPIDLREHEPQTLTIYSADIRTLSQSLLVRAQKKSSADETVITTDQINAHHAGTVAEVLSQQAGLNVRESRSGEALISINGSESRHVRVLLNGIPLSPNADGSINLSQIPLASVKEIRITRGAAAQSAGPGALGGLIDIRTIAVGVHATPVAEVRSERGSWERVSHQIHLSAGDAHDRLSLELEGEQRQQLDRFGYSYTAQPSPKTYSGERQNNDALSRLYAATLRYGDFSFTGSRYTSERGLPDRASAPNLTARSFETRTQGGMQWKTELSDLSLLMVALSYQQNRNSAIDTLSLPTSSRFQSQYDNTLWQSEILLKHQVSSALSFDTRTEFSLEHVNHQDLARPGASLGVADRRSGGIGATAHLDKPLPKMFFLHELGIALSGRYDYIDSKSARNDTVLSSQINRLSPGITLSLRHPGRFSSSISVSRGQNWSAPSLTSLFWRRDARSEGNPSLRPELAKSEQLTVGINWHLEGIEMDGQMTWHEALYTDLVIWRPDFRGVFRPVNLASAKITGRSDQLAVRFFKQKLAFSYLNDLLDTRNRTTGIDFDKQLTFRPRYTTRLECIANFHSWDLQLSHEIVALRFATESNTRWYDPYEVTNIKGGCTIRPGFAVLRLGIAVNNLLDTQYAQIAHYPMPGRSWEISARLTLELSHEKNTSTKSKDTR